MDELEISGSRYISARRAAREHNYHSDYIGQLIRSSKVLGQKVGRSWYVEERSLLAYLDKEKSTTRNKVVVEEVSPEIKPNEETPIEPIPVVTQSKEFKEEPTAPVEVLEEVDVHPVAIRKVEDEGVRTRFTPVLVTEEKEEEESKEEVLSDGELKGLRYLPDDEPLISEIAEEANSEATVADISLRLEKAKNPLNHRGGHALPIVGVLALGVVTFGVAAAASYFITYQTFIADGQVTASIGFSSQN